MELRSFGRRRGRKLSGRQSHLVEHLLPRVAINLAEPCHSSAALFPRQIEATWLEVGFGGGEHLVAMAQRHPSVGLIGCEPFLDGVVKVLDAVSELGCTNIRVHADDARPLLRWLPDASIDRAFVLFPDPWPKRRHVKRRLINEDFFELLERVLRPGAELRVATDIADYARTILIAHRASRSFAWTAKSAIDWQQRPADWIETRYERKAIREGRRCIYLIFRRRIAAK